MSVRFKFRSSAVEDSVDLGHGRSSITVRDLKSEIMKKKNLKLGQGFDLVFSDALTGEVLDDENRQLPSGSSVIVKRVPASSTAAIRSAKLQTAELHNAEPELMAHNNANAQSMLPTKSEPKVEKYTQFERASPSDHPAIQAAYFPLEPKCSLCRTFLKDAVIIPCCQHSFCEKCIRLALAEKGKCPMCSSTKSRVDNLLPNLSLRQAIDTFMNTQMTVTGSEKDLHMDAPDEESRVEGMDVVPTCPINIKCKPEVLEDVTEFQDENQPCTVPEMQKEVYTAKKNEDNHIITSGKERYIHRPGRQKKGDRTCYMCGSPDHLIRGCPVAASHHMYVNGNASFAGSMPGYPPPHWHTTCMPLANSFVNMYPDYGMISSNATMAPVTTFPPPYVPFMCGSLCGPRAWVTDQDNEIKDHYHHREMEEPHNWLSFQPKDRGLNHSEDVYGRSEKKYKQEKSSYEGTCFIDEKHDKSRKNHRISHQQRSIPEVGNVVSEEAFRHHCKSSRKHGERKRVHESDGSRCHNFFDTEMDNKKYKPENCSQIGCFADDNNSSGNKKHRREGEYRCGGSQHVKQNARNPIQGK